MASPISAKSLFSGPNRCDEPAASRTAATGEEVSSSIAASLLRVGYVDSGLLSSAMILAMMDSAISAGPDAPIARGKGHFANFKKIDFRV